jgi:sodium/hydrogen exchanger 8
VIRTGYEVVAYSAETIVFLFLGIGIFSLNHPFQDLSWGLLVTSLFNVNIARALNVSIVSFIANKYRSQNLKLTREKQFVVWFSGLRGAMAYALALQSATDLKMGPLILIDTLFLSLFTILIQGSALHPVLNRCDVR